MFGPVWYCCQTPETLRPFLKLRFESKYPASTFRAYLHRQSVAFTWGPFRVICVMVQLSGPIERGFSVFRRKCAKAWQHLKKKPAAFKYRQTTITHQPFHFANNRAASCNHYMGLRGRVCVSCIIVGLQMYVCIQSAHCKTVVRCWFTCKSVIEKENRCKPLRLALGTKLLFRVKLTVLLVLNSAFEVIFDKGLRSTTYSSFIYLFFFCLYW